MLLGLSSAEDDSIDPAALREGAGVEHGKALADMVSALNAGDRSGLDTSFAQLDELLGVAGRIDAVAVYANFSMMTRVADSTGTPLDAGTTAMTGPLRAALGVDEMESARL